MTFKVIGSAAVQESKEFYHYTPASRGLAYRNQQCGVIPFKPKKGPVKFEATPINIACLALNVVCIGLAALILCCLLPAML